MWEKWCLNEFWVLILQSYLWKFAFKILGVRRSLSMYMNRSKSLLINQYKTRKSGKFKNGNILGSKFSWYRYMEIIYKILEQIAFRFLSFLDLFVSAIEHYIFHSLFQRRQRPDTGPICGSSAASFGILLCVGFYVESSSVCC